MGLATKVFEAVKEIIGPARLVLGRAEQGEECKSFVLPTENPVVFPGLLVIDWSMVCIQTSCTLHAELKKKLYGESLRNEKDHTAPRDTTNQSAMQDGDYIERFDESKEQLYGFDSVLPLIQRVFFNLFAFLQANRCIRYVVFRADTYSPVEKERTQANRQKDRKFLPYSATKWRIAIDTGELVDRETGVAAKNIDFQRLMFNRTSLMSQLLRCMLHQLSCDSKFRLWDPATRPAGVRFLFDFADVTAMPEGKRIVRPLCLEVVAGSSVYESEFAPVSEAGEADIGIIVWLARFLDTAAIVLSGDGDQLPLLLYYLQQHTGQTVYMLKNRSATFDLSDPKYASMWNMNVARDLLRQHDWSPDKIALLAILATNDYFIAEDKAALFPRIGIQHVADVIRHLTDREMYNLQHHHAAFQMFALWVWMTNYCIAGPRRKNATKDPPPKSFTSANQIVNEVRSFERGYETLCDDAKTAKSARDKMTVLSEGERVLKHLRSLVHRNMLYWQLDPKAFKISAKYTFE